MHGIINAFRFLYNSESLDLGFMDLNGSGGGEVGQFIA